MKKHYFTLLFVGFILFSGIFMISTINTQAKHTSIVDNGDAELESSVLGDVEGTITPAFTPLGLTFLAGSLWAASSTESKIYKINPITGGTITSIDVAFEVSGLTTDGTYLYASLLASGSGNGTIAKYQTDGTFVSKIYHSLNAQYFQGLAWDGSHLWASQTSPNRAVRIDPDTGVVVSNVSTGLPLVDLVWRNDLLWGVDDSADLIRAIDPSTGRTQEIFAAPYTTGEYGLADNGTHFFFSETGTPTIHILPIPRSFGAIWNQHPTPSTLTRGLTWNGTHYFLVDNDAQKVFILDDGTFQQVGNFDIYFEPYAMTLIGDYLYVSQYASPYTIHKYAQNGTEITNFPAAYRYFSFEYYGGRLWATDQLNAYIRELNTTTFSVIVSHAVELHYIGLTYDANNDVFWAVDRDSNYIYQLDPSAFLQTGPVINSVAGDYGLVYDGEHLIMCSWSTDTLYKIICSPWLAEVPTEDSVDWGDAINLTFSLHSATTGGFYRITSNSTYSKDWTPWANNIPITELVTSLWSGAYSFTVEYNDSYGNIGIPFIYEKVLEADLVLPWFVEIETADWMLWNIPINLTFRLHDDAAGGFYRITSNSTYSKDWTVWDNTTLITALATGLGLGPWSFTVEYNDSYGNIGIPFIYEKVLEADLILPWFEEVETSDLVPWDTPINLTFRLHDDVAGGFYRITSNSTYFKDWTVWDNTTLITALVTGLESGPWSFTIEYNDSYGNLGTPFVYIKVVDTQPKGGIPGFADYFSLLTILSLVSIIFFKQRTKTYI